MLASTRRLYHRRDGLLHAVRARRRTYERTFRAYAGAGYDTVYLTQIGSNQHGFFDFFTRKLRPRLDDLLSS